MKRYQIKVDGLQYEGLFASGCDAIINALEQHPHARRISAKVIV
jgi:hypothetical protein